MTSCTHPADNVDRHLEVIDQAIGVCSGYDILSQDSHLQSLSCPGCSETFDTVALLRRHLTTLHGRFARQIRQCAPADMSEGLPTCKRCLLSFTTWASFRYHIQYVCIHALFQDEAAEEHEHRLRVAEFMQFSNAANSQALIDHPELLAYFLNRCILCRMFQLTPRAMLLQLSTEHAEIFTQHGHAVDTIHKVCQVQSPCELCGQCVRQQHYCVILGRAAMCATTRAPPCTSHGTTPTVLFTCDFCRKAYVTRHGLRDHIQKYHATLDAAAPAPPVTNAALHAVFHEAVLNGDNSAILQDQAVLSYPRALLVRCAPRPSANAAFLHGT